METVTLITVIVGFLGLILMNLQLNNQVKSEVRMQFRELKQDIKDLRHDISDTNKRIDSISEKLSARIDAVNSRLDSLYRELFKKDIA